MQKNETTDSEPANCTDLIPYKLAKFEDLKKLKFVTFITNLALGWIAK